MSTMQDNESRMKYVEKMFGISGMPLSVPGRELIGEGVLMKMCRKKPKHRHFFLFNDILIYGRIIIYKKKLVSQHVFELETLSVEEMPPDSEVGTNFPFKLMSPKKSFIVFAATEDERTQWILHIRRYSHECGQTTLARKNSSAIFSPVWVPDDCATKCMSCMLTEFSIFQRRHHCRNCGDVVCDKCSQHRVILPNQSITPLRVCVRCYLSHNNTTDTSENIPNDNSSLQDNSDSSSSDSNS